MKGNSTKDDCLISYIVCHLRLLSQSENSRLSPKVDCLVVNPMVKKETAVGCSRTTAMNSFIRDIQSKAKTTSFQSIAKKHGTGKLGR